MLFRPHAYQLAAIQHIIDHPACGLFLDMGLGKTVSTLTALNDLMYDYYSVKPGTVLVIAPLKVAQSVWATEAAKWDHLKHLRVSRALGSVAQRKAALKKPADIYVINRENVSWLVDLWGRHWPYKVVVVDELSSFKDPGSTRFRQLRKVRPLCDRVIGLTGTPAPNGLQDLWSQLYLMDRGERLEKTVTAFRERYLRPVSTDGGYVVYKWGLQKGADERIYSRIGDICISMKAADWLELPERMDILAPVTVSPGGQKLMRQLEADLVLPLDEDEALVADSAAALAGKLAQMAGGAVYTGKGREWVRIHDDKLDALEELLEALEGTGENALVAYWYQHMKDRILARFPKARELKTQQDVDDWNAGEVRVMLAHPASAGMGLNLQDGGNVIVWVEKPWALEPVLQFNARLHRQGQTRPVRIITLVSEGTIDEDIEDAIAHKDMTQERLMVAVKKHIKKTPTA